MFKILRKARVNRSVGSFLLLLESPVRSISGDISDTAGRIYSIDYLIG